MGGPPEANKPWNSPPAKMTGAAIQRLSGVRGAALLALYYVVPHFELFDLRRRLVHGYGPVEASVYLTVLGYGLVFILVFLMLAWLLYRHKRFVRGALPV